VTRGVRERVAAIDQQVLRAEGFVVAALVAVMTAIIFAQVVFRYVLSSPLVWSEELARYLFVWITMVGAGAAVHLGQHYGLDILAKLLPPPLQKLAGFLASVLIGASAVTLIWQGLIESAGAVHHAASSVEVPMVWFYASIPIGGALMLWHVLARLVVLGPGASALAAHE
jgi:TRAP-type C4-dicarboxylate transport system permease small subunit